MNKPRGLINVLLGLYYQSQLRKDQWKEPEELRKIQFKKLKRLITHAYTYVPYYHRQLSTVGIKPEDINDFEDITRIPMISKRSIRDNYRDFITKGVNESRLKPHETSGSTGIPLRVLSDSVFSPSSSRYTFFECGVKPSDNLVTVWGRGSESVRWGQKYVRLWGDVRETVVPLLVEERLVEVLRGIRPDVLVTFPSVLATLANYDLSGINPRLIFTLGEMVTKHCRDIVRIKFDQELLETYGSVEFGSMAFECREHCGLHMITDNVYIEFVDDRGDHVSPGEKGEIIVTGLLNRMMPLIRYRIGDLGIPSDEKCSCGRSWPIINSIEGRVNDLLILPSGRRISWLYLYRLMYEGADACLVHNPLLISQYQLVQEHRNRIVFKVVKGTQYNPRVLDRMKNKIEAEFAKQGENLKVAVEVVEGIRPGRTGKRRMLVSRVSVD